MFGTAYPRCTLSCPPPVEIASTTHTRTHTRHTHMHTHQRVRAGRAGAPCPWALGSGRAQPGVQAGPSPHPPPRLAWDRPSGCRANLPHLGSHMPSETPFPDLDSLSQIVFSNSNQSFAPAHGQEVGLGRMSSSREILPTLGSIHLLDWAFATRGAQCGMLTGPSPPAKFSMTAQQALWD